MYGGADCSANLCNKRGYEPLSFSNILKIDDIIYL